MARYVKEIETLALFRLLLIKLLLLQLRKKMGGSVISRTYCFILHLRILAI